MIKYQNVSNELLFETKNIPQNCGEIIEQIDIDNYNSSCRYFLELECPRKLKYISEEVKFSGNVGSVTLPNIITENVGKIFVQLVIRNANGEVINKSLKAINPLYMVNMSINAVRDLAKEKVNDCITYIIQSVNELNNIKIELENKVKNGEFDGAKGDKGDKGDVGPQGIQGVKGNDGSVIKISGNQVNEIAFTEEPQMQINSKASIKEVNALSMCLSNNLIYNIFSTPNTWTENRTDYIAPANGYVVVTFKTNNNITTQNFLTDLVVINGDYYIVSTDSSNPTGLGNEFELCIPVKEKTLVRLFVLQYQNIVLSSFSSKFIYAEVIK